MEQAGSKVTLPAAAIAALRQGNKIEAIKIVRLEQHLDLKNSKDLVEAYLQTQPAMMAEIAAAQKQAGQRFLWWLAVMVGGAVLAFMLLHKQ